MNKISILAFLFLCCLGCSLNNLHSLKQISTPDFKQKLTQKVLPSIVRLGAWEDGNFYPEGNGVLLSAEGTVLTCSHIIDLSPDYFVKVDDGFGWSVNCPFKVEEYHRGIGVCFLRLMCQHGNKGLQGVQNCPLCQVMLSRLKQPWKVAICKKGVTPLNDRFIAIGEIYNREGMVSCPSSFWLEDVFEKLVIRCPLGIYPHKNYAIQVLHYNGNLDLALLKIEHLERGLPSKIFLREYYSPEDMVYIIGYCGHKLKTYSGLVDPDEKEGVVSYGGLHYCAKLDSELTLGMSGSPVVNEFGSLIGLCSSRDYYQKNYSYFLQTKTVYRWLRKNMEK